MVKVSVVVCTKNRAEMLKDCVDSLLNQDIKENNEILIIDNDSNDDTEEVANRLIAENENIRYFKEKVIGYSAPRNRGWKESKGKYVAYIDDDEIAPCHWLRKIFESFQNELSPDIVGGNYLLKYDVPAPKWFRESMEVKIFGEREGLLDVKKFPYGFAGGNVAFRREALEKLDGFSEMFNMKDGMLLMGEDTDIGKRAIENGMRLYYHPDAFIYHRMTEKNFEVIKRQEGAKKRGFSAGKLFGDKSLVYDFYHSGTLFVMSVAVVFARKFKRSYLEIRLSEKIAFRKGYREAQKL